MASDDLAAFLRARLDQQYDEAYADREFSNLAGVQEYADFIVRDIAAKRRILDWLERQRAWAAENNLWAYDDEEPLKMLALPYADHHDYREEWKP